MTALFISSGDFFIRAGLIFIDCIWFPYFFFVGGTDVNSLCALMFCNYLIPFYQLILDIFRIYRKKKKVSLLFIISIDCVRPNSKFQNNTCSVRRKCTLTQADMFLFIASYVGLFDNPFLPEYLPLFVKSLDFSTLLFDAKTCIERV